MKSRRVISLFAVLALAALNVIAAAQSAPQAAHPAALAGSLSSSPATVGESQRVPAFDQRRAQLPRVKRSGGPLDESAAFLFLPAVVYPAGPAANSVAVADLNGDGRPDLIVANGCLTPGSCNFSNGGVSVLLGNGDGTFQAPVTYNTDAQGTGSLAVADLNGDGRPDVVVVNAWSDSISILIGKGDGTFDAPAVYNSGGLISDAIAIGDLNGDGKLDLVVASFDENSNSSNGGVSVLLGNGDGTFQAAVTYSSGAYDATSVAIADLNHDGHLDLVVTNLCQEPNTCGEPSIVTVLLGNGDGTFQSPVSYSANGFPATTVAVGDVSGDGKPDLVVATAYPFGGIEANVLLGNGDGTFQAPIGYSSGGSANEVLATDVNGDGALDLLLSTEAGEGQATLMLGNGDGTFQPAETFLSGACTEGGPDENGVEPNSITVADLNGDGTPDILIASGSWATSNCPGTVSVFLNNNGAPLTTTSLVSSVNPVDFSRPVTYTAIVTSQAGGAVNGTVTFTDSVFTATTVVTLVNNQASYTTKYRGKGNGGPHVITASYPGELHKAFGSQSAPLTEYVRADSTKTTLATSGSPSQSGQPVTFTATITTKPKYGSIPDGESVMFYDGNKLMGSVPVNGGQAAFTISTLSAKKHSIKAVYPGDNTFEPSSHYVVQIVQ